MRVGPYEVLDELGRGGAGVVYRARDSRDGRAVAIKVLAARSASPTAAERFRREAEALGRLRHPNLVAFLEAGEQEGLAYVVLDLVPGGTLAQRLRGGPLPERQAAELVLKLAHALAHAHARGVLHRDLKPGNVLLDPQGEPRLTDFGLAAALLSESERLTRTGQFLGTPGYMAPEQLDNRRGAIGPPTDVFGLGGLLHAALTGEPPNRGRDLREILEATVRPPVPPSHVRRGIAPALDDLCVRCLARDPRDRPDGAAAVATLLDRFLAGSPPAPERASPAVWLGAGSLLLAALALATAIAPGDGRPPGAPAGDPSSVASGVPAVAPSPVDPRPSRVARVPLQVSLEVGALLDRAEDCQRRQDRTGAVAAYDRALELDPRLSVAWCNRGLLRSELGDPRGGLEDLERSLALDPANSHAWSNRGLIRAKLGELQGALDDYGRAIELAETASMPDHNRAVTRLRLGDQEGALADYDRAVELGPDAPEPVANRGLLREMRGDFQGAMDDYRRALQLYPPDAPRLATVRERLARLESR